MVLDDLKKSFDDAVKRTKDAVEATTEATEGKEEKQIEDERKKAKQKLEEKYKEAIRKAIFQHLDNQEWDEAIRVAKEKGGVTTDEEISKIISNYITIRAKRSEQRLLHVRYKLNQIENHLEQAESSSRLSGIKTMAQQAINHYEDLEQDQIRKAQKDLSNAENAYKKFGGGNNVEKLMKTEHKDINRLDKDLRQAEKDLQKVLKIINS